MESTSEAGVPYTRHDFDANVNMQDLVDSYMLAFQSCVEKGRVSGLMCSYNMLNGVHSCANSWLLKTVARGAWGFEGYVTAMLIAMLMVTHTTVMWRHQKRLCRRSCGWAQTTTAAHL